MVMLMLPVLLLLITASSSSDEINYEEEVGTTMDTNTTVKEDGDAFSGLGKVDYSLEFVDEPQRNDYSPEELEFVTQLQTAAAKRRIVRTNLIPICYAQGSTGVCCFGFNINLIRKIVIPFQTCLEAGFKPTELAAFAALTYNHIPLLHVERHFGKVCWGLPPPLRKLRACIWIYHFDVNLANREFHLCTILELTKHFRISFNCLTYTEGHFRVTRDFPPPKGMVNLSFGGRHRFHQKRFPPKLSNMEWQNLAVLYPKQSIAINGSVPVIDPSVVQPSTLLLPVYMN